MHFYRESAAWGAEGLTAPNICSSSSENCEVDNIVAGGTKRKLTKAAGIWEKHTSLSSSGTLEGRKGKINGTTRVAGMRIGPVGGALLKAITQHSHRRDTAGKRAASSRRVLKSLR